MILSILWPVVIIAGLSLIFGSLLAVASKYLLPEGDPRVDQVRDSLPGANCGACGFAGCDALARAIVEEGAPINSCPVANAEALKNIAELLGEEIGDFKKLTAVVACKSNLSNAHIKYVYQGMEDCVAAAAVSGGYKMCRFSCLGFGNCAKICPAGAISVEEGVAVVDSEKCIACGKCATTCPKGIISLIPQDAPVVIMCKSYGRGKEVRDSCEAGCIGCGLCEKNCAFDAIHLVDNLPVIDYDKCTGCKMCVEKCPRKCIHVNEESFASVV